MADFVGLRPKTYSELTDDNDENKQAKNTKKCVIKRKCNFEDYKNSLDTKQLEKEIKHLEPNGNTTQYGL